MTVHRRKRIKTGKNTYLNISDSGVSQTTKLGNTTVNSKFGNGGTTIRQNLGDGYYSQRYFKGVSKTRQASSRKSAGSEGSAEAGIAFAFLIALAPLLYASIYTYALIANTWNWNAILAVVIAAMPTLIGIVMLFVSRLFRKLYLGAATILIAVMVFNWIHSAYSGMWAALGALIVLAVGWSLTKSLAKSE